MNINLRCQNPCTAHRLLESILFFLLLLIIIGKYTLFLAEIIIISKHGSIPNLKINNPIELKIEKSNQTQIHNRILTERPDLKQN